MSSRQTPTPLECISTIIGGDCSLHLLQDRVTEHQIKYILSVQKIGHLSISFTPSSERQRDRTPNRIQVFLTPPSVQQIGHLPLLFTPSTPRQSDGTHNRISSRPIPTPLKCISINRTPYHFVHSNYSKTE